MDILWLFLAGLLVVTGIVGSLLPVLPGPPLSYAGLLVMQLRSEAPFTTRFLVWWAILVIAVTVLDYVIPIYGTKRFGGTRHGLIGCMVGFLVGFWFGPIGIVVGPFAGAFIGELVAHNDSSRAMRAAVGSFIGFLLGTMIKLVLSGLMLYYFVDAIF